MASVHQENVARYHMEVSQHMEGGGHDMYIFHRDWHQQNRDPVPPERPDRDWGTGLVFGTNFLQMHHEMVKATAAEPHLHMMHASIVAWYLAQSLELPLSWDPDQPIPVELGYQPDPSVYPKEIRQALEFWAQQEGRSVEEFLTRNTETPAYTLQGYFTIDGVAPDEPGEPITGARKLATSRTPTSWAVVSCSRTTSGTASSAEP